jgi:hypothetical protein
LANVGNHRIHSKAHFGVGLLFYFSILFSLPAAAQSYPISGVWAAIDPQFPKARSEMCIAVKTFGTAAVANNLIAEIILFDQNKRFDVKADATANDHQINQSGRWWVSHNGDFQQRHQLARVQKKSQLLPDRNRSANDRDSRC